MNKKMPRQDDSDDEVTQRIPIESMRDLVFGEGHAPVGPRKKTRNLSAPKLCPVCQDGACETKSNQCGQ